MAKNRFRTPHCFGYVGNGGNIVSHENCNSIIIKIKSVYSSYSKIMSLEDQKQLLNMLKEIEQAKKCIKCTAREEMYGIIRKMERKYHELKKHTVQHFPAVVEKQR